MGWANQAHSVPDIRGIEDLKKSAGFETGTSAHYQTSRDAVKLQMISLKTTRRNDVDKGSGPS